MRVRVSPRAPVEFSAFTEKQPFCLNIYSLGDAIALLVQAAELIIQFASRAITLIPVPVSFRNRCCNSYCLSDAAPPPYFILAASPKSIQVRAPLSGNNFRLCGRLGDHARHHLVQPPDENFPNVPMQVQRSLLWLICQGPNPPFEKIDCNGALTYLVGRLRAWRNR